MVSMVKVYRPQNASLGSVKKHRKKERFFFFFFFFQWVRDLPQLFGVPTPRDLPQTLP